MNYANPYSRRELASLPLNFWLVGQKDSSSQRKGRYTSPSMRHPGKMLPALAREILLEYTKPGDWILDPMSGIGTTGVEAIHLGRHYVGVELEERFVRWQRQNLEFAHSQGAAGQFAVIRADARRLCSRHPDRQAIEPGRIDAVITSPPYGDRLSSVRTPSPILKKLIAGRRFGKMVIPSTYGSTEANLGNLSDHEYLREMGRVYAGCLELLKPGGYLIVVIRPGRHKWRLRPLHHQTARICVALGFEFLDERLAVLARIDASANTEPTVFAHPSFFKRLAIAHLREAGHPVSLDQLEYVLVFRKPGGAETGCTDTGGRKSGRQAALVGSAPDQGRKEDLAPGIGSPT